MPQDPDRFHERRAGRRHSAAFAFWFQRGEGRPRRGAWMLDMGTGGAAFLASAADTPAVGERVRLSEMFSPDRLVREQQAALPPFARVLRVEDENGATRRVAMRFEADVSSSLAELRCGQSATSCRQQLATPRVPPCSARGRGPPAIAGAASR